MFFEKLKKVIYSIIWIGIAIGVVAVLISVPPVKDVPVEKAKVEIPNPENDRVNYDPQMEQKLFLMQNLTSQIRTCMRDYQRSLLQLGMRNREQLTSAAIKTCGGAVSAAPSDLREIALAGLPLLAQQELDVILSGRR